MEVRAPRHRHRVALVVEVGERRLPHPLGGALGQLLERRQAPRRHQPRQLAPLEQEQGAEVVLGRQGAARGESAGRRGAERRLRQRPGGGQVGRAPGGAQRQRGSPRGPLERGGTARTVGVGDEDASDLLQRHGETVGGEPTGDPAEVLLGAGRGRHPARQRPARSLRRRSRIRLAHTRLAGQQGRKLTTATPAHVVELGLGLCVTLDRVGREFIDVGEDRLGQQTQLLGIEACLPRGRREVAPGNPGSDSVGGLQRVEGPPLAQLAPAKDQIDLASRLAPGLGIADQGDELSQRLGDAGTHTTPEAALERTGVLGHLAGD